MGRNGVVDTAVTPGALPHGLPPSGVRRRASAPIRSGLALLLGAILAALPAQASTARARHRSFAAQRVSAQHRGAAARGKTKRAGKPSIPALDVSKINDPQLRDLVNRGARGNAVVRMAILLDRLSFSPGQITDAYTDNLGKAVTAFQSASGLPATGNVDAATWAALNDDQSKGRVEPVAQGGQPNNPAASGGNGQNQNQAKPQSPPPSGQQPQPNPDPPSGQSPPPALVAYTITMEDVSGPFTHLPHATGEREMLLEAKLKKLNYQSAEELLGEKFHCSPKLLAELNPHKSLTKGGEQIQAPNVEGPAPGQAASVVVDGTNRSVTAVDAGGKVLAFFPATVGSEHDPLPDGTWKIVDKEWYPTFKYNPMLFWDAENKRPRAKIAPGPKNPVGVVWLGLSKPHYGIHGTPAPATIGRTESHGCIRLTNWDAAELANMVKRGTPAILKGGEPSHAELHSSSSSL